jgi:hypothetical protein
MNERLGYRIHSELKAEYDNHILDKYGHKRNKCGSELEKLIKFNLALEGHDLYCNDPDVVELVGKVGGSFGAHTYNVSKKGDVSGDVVVDLVEEIKSLRAEVKQLRSEVKGKPSKRTGSMSDFKRQFKAEYGEFKQVSKRDLVRFVTNNYDVHDSRAIQNRINYLLAHDVLELSAPNVFNIKI